MPHSPEDKKRAITRLRRIRGQSEALERTIQHGATCGEVLQQLAAMRGAVNGLMSDVLEGHLRETFGLAGADGGAPPAAVPNPAHLQRAVDESVRLVRTYLK